MKGALARRPLSRTIRIAAALVLVAARPLPLDPDLRAAAPPGWSVEGKQEAVVRELERKMEEASQRLEFERAAVLRDQIRAVERTTERQKISSAARGDEDIIALAQNKDHAYVEVFFIRNGKLVERDVAIGLKNWDYVEIVDGLAEGDAVVVSLDRVEVKAGARFEIEESPAEP